tara:strand:- start:271 stop:549 length:279 start_codon:yes stop_codon:yes gene_type:complete
VAVGWQPLPVFLFGGVMFNETERNIITMALMYLKNDYTEDDLADLGMECKGILLERMCQEMIEDFVGPTWDEEATAKNIEQYQLKLFREPKE